MLDVKRLHVFREVARSGSFSAAAASLGYTQPAISRQVALLERETGATLFERRTGGARLTDAGALLLRHTDVILSRLKDAERELSELLGMETGKLRMSTLSSAATTIVPLAIGEFRKRLPNIELSVSMVEPSGIMPLLESGELDLALCNDASHLELPGVEAVHLFDEPLLIAMPRDHILAQRKRLRLSDLANERWMLGTTTACPDAGRFIHACHVAGFEPQIAFHNDDYTAILGFVAAGVGVAPVPEMVARTAPEGVRISALGSGGITRSIIASLPAGYRTRPAQVMLEILREVSEQWVANPARHAAAA